LVILPLRWVSAEKTKYPKKNIPMANFLTTKDSHNKDFHKQGFPKQGIPYSEASPIATFKQNPILSNLAYPW